jgi:hypothetical protein
MLRAVPQSSRTQHHETVKSIRTQLQEIEQSVEIAPRSNPDSIDLNRISATAAFYQKAALLYLEQILPVDIRWNDTYISSLIDDCFELLEMIELCTSPWPLFILANWSMEDQHRIKVLTILESMNKKRRIQNVEVIGAIIQAIWKRVDLDDAGTQYHELDWRDFIDMGGFVPSFI